MKDVIVQSFFIHERLYLLQFVDFSFGALDR